MPRCDDLPSSPGRAHVISQVARYRMLAGADEEAIRIGGEALAIAEQLGLVELQAHALINIGTAKVSLGDAGRAPGPRARHRDRRRRRLVRGRTRVQQSRRLGPDRWVTCAAVSAHGRSGGSCGATRACANLLRFSRNVQLWLLFQVGSWDSALPPTEEFLAACEAGEPHYHEGGMRLARADVRLARDDVEGALDDVRQVVPLARQAGDPQQRVPWLSGPPACSSKPESARGAAARTRGDSSASPGLGSRRPRFRRRRSSAAPRSSPQQLERGPQTKWTDASRALLRGDFVEGADLLDEIGDAKLEALARLRAAEQLVAEGRRAEADEQLQRSLGFWRSVGATRYIREGEALLAAAS